LVSLPGYYQKVAVNDGYNSIQQLSSQHRAFQPHHIYYFKPTTKQITHEDTHRLDEVISDGCIIIYSPGTFVQNKRQFTSPQNSYSKVVSSFLALCIPDLLHFTCSNQRCVPCHCVFLSNPSRFSSMAGLWLDNAHLNCTNIHNQ